MASLPLAVAAAAIRARLAEMVALAGVGVALAVLLPLEVLRLQAGLATMAVTAPVQVQVGLLVVVAGLMQMVVTGLQICLGMAEMELPVH